MTIAFRTDGLVQPSFAEAVTAAVASLISVTPLGEGRLLHLPMVFPNGSAVTVRVDKSPRGYLVSDYAFAYREAVMMGGERSFRRHLQEVAGAAGVEAGEHNQFWLHARPEQLAGTIAAVGMASYEIMRRVQESLPLWHEEQAEAELYHRLIGLFGEDRVFANVQIPGASSLKWTVAARVVVSGRQTVFDTVSRHHASVYSAVSKFSDLARLEHGPVRVAVVENKEQMGAYLALIGESANIIEASAPDETLLRLAA